MKNAIPTRTPISPTLDASDYQDQISLEDSPIYDEQGLTISALGTSETKAPEKNPNMSEYTTSPADVCTPNHENMRMPEAAEKGMIMLNGPTLSAKKLGKTRPKMDVAFMIDRE